jgi:hypothetical protein
MSRETLRQLRPHPQDLPRPLALLHGIHEQDAAQSLSLLSPIDSEVTEKNAWVRFDRGGRGAASEGTSATPMAWALMAKKPRQARSSPAWAVSVATVSRV